MRRSVRAVLVARETFAFLPSLLSDFDELRICCGQCRSYYRVRSLLVPLWKPLRAVETLIFCSLSFSHDFFVINETVYLHKLRKMQYKLSALNEIRWIENVFVFNSNTNDLRRQMFFYKSFGNLWLIPKKSYFSVHWKKSGDNNHA